MSLLLIEALKRFPLHGHSPNPSRYRISRSWHAISCAAARNNRSGAKQTRSTNSGATSSGSPDWARVDGRSRSFVAGRQQREFTLDRYKKNHRTAPSGDSMVFSAANNQAGPGSTGGDQPRSEPLRVSPERPPRDEWAYTEGRTPSRADRRPARDDFPPRRIRATVPAHSKPECSGDAFLVCDELIER